MSEHPRGKTAGSTSPNEHTCGAMQQHPTVPVELWYVCNLRPGHAGVHEAFGSDPLVRWKRSADEVYELEPA